MAKSTKWYTYYCPRCPGQDMYPIKQRKVVCEDCGIKMELVDIPSGLAKLAQVNVESKRAGGGPTSAGIYYGGEQA